MKQSNHPIDLNDLYFFAQIMDAGNFSAAARQMNISKATLSRRIAKLEERIGVTLIVRNTRQFQPTSAGLIYYEHCARLRQEADSAQRMVQQYTGEPQGVVRFSCPAEILENYVNDVLTDFMAMYPKISLEVLSVNRYVDVVAERQDFAIRAKTFPLPDSDLIVRRFFASPVLLVAAPQLLPQPIALAEALQALPSLSYQNNAPHYWQLQHKVLGAQKVFHRPKLVARNLHLIKQAVLKGQGIAQLPFVLVRDALHSGQLVSVLNEDWLPPYDVIHAAYPSRSGMLPSVATLLDFLQERLAVYDEKAA